MLGVLYSERLVACNHQSFPGLVVRLLVLFPPCNQPPFLLYNPRQKLRKLAGGGDGGGVDASLYNAQRRRNQAGARSERPSPQTRMNAAEVEEGGPLEGKQTHAKGLAITLRREQELLRRPHTCMLFALALRARVCLPYGI